MSNKGRKTGEFHRNKEMKNTERYEIERDSKSGRVCHIYNKLCVLVLQQIWRILHHNNSTSSTNIDNI